MSEFNNPFVLSPEQYKRDINVLNHYANDVAHFLHIQTGKDLDRCINYVKKNLSKGGKFEFKDVPIRSLQRQENGDRVEENTTLWKYISDSISKRELIAPTFTTYINEETKPSLLAKFIETNVALRGKAKKEQFAAEANGEKTLAAIKKIEQTNRKLSNNAISGAHVSASTVLYNKTAHSTLTSNCRSTSGYGNANNEKFLSGNRHYFNHHVVINNIISITRNTDYSKLETLINTRNLHIPTVDETVECVRYSSHLYWFEKHYFQKIVNLIEKLNPLQRAAFVYTGDIYHLMKHNSDFVKEFVFKLSKKVTGEIDNPKSILKNAPEDHLILAHQICANETRGIGKDYSKIENSSAIHTLALTTLNIATVITEYTDLIDTLWVTKNLPASVAHFPDSIRRAALTSDTDSTIFTVQDWVSWYKGKISFDDEANSVAATMIFLASSTITHVLAIMSANFGIHPSKLFKIAMKNEFKFDVFVPTQIGKHYYANISCQEGNVKPEHELEIKGVHLKSSNAPKNIIKESKQMVEDIMNDVMKDGEVSALKYINKVADIEREIISSIKKGEYTYFRLGSVKSAESYTNEKELSPYAKHMFWNEVFGQFYGTMPEPPYGNVKIPVCIDTTTKFKTWVSSIHNKELATKLTNWMSKNDKTNISIFYVPTQILDTVGLPVELLNIIDYRRIILDCTISFRIILETIGIYINDKALLSDSF
jgi:hypothetical protein